MNELNAALLDDKPLLLVALAQSAEAWEFVDKIVRLDPELIAAHETALARAKLEAARE